VRGACRGAGSEGRGGAIIKSGRTENGINANNLYVCRQTLGNGDRSECTVGAIKVALPGTALFEYARFSIHHEPSGLPDGDYEVAFEGKVVALRKQGFAWLARA
jgi:hypothetical protein